MMTDRIEPTDEEIDVFGVSHQGLARAENEDQFLVCSLHKKLRIHQTSLPNPKRLARTGGSMAYMLIVADGVGGHAAGQKASGTALQYVVDYITNTLRCYYTGDPMQEDAFMHELHRAFIRSHMKVRKKGRKNPDFQGMATTLTMVTVVWPIAYLVHVGDSRCYLFRNGELQRLTRDQTVAQDLVDEGVLRTREAEASQWSNILSSAIGGNKAAPEISRHELEWSDTLLLCSDGLTKHVDDGGIGARLAEPGSARTACEALLQDVLDDGASDNVTVVVGRLRGARPEDA